MSSQVCDRRWVTTGETRGMPMPWLVQPKAKFSLFLYLHLCIQCLKLHSIEVYRSNCMINAANIKVLPSFLFFNQSAWKHHRFSSKRLEASLAWSKRLDLLELPESHKNDRTFSWCTPEIRGGSGTQGRINPHFGVGLESIASADTVIQMFSMPYSPVGQPKFRSDYIRVASVPK